MISGGQSLRFGNTTVNILSDGTFLQDGGALFGQIPKVMWEQQVKPDRKNRVRMGLNCMLIQSPSGNFLIDTGAGAKRADRMKDAHGLNGNKLLKELKKIGLTAREIDMVILTHLHFDSAGGCTKLDRSGRAIPTFPNAEYIAQKSCWDDANSPSERNVRSFYTEDFAPLEEAGVLKLIEGDNEVAPGIRTQVTNAHSDGHQVVLVEVGSERIAFAGDLIPTPYHLPLISISALDQSPNETLEAKRRLLKMAVEDGWLLVFGHAQEPKSGYLQQRNGKAQFSSKTL